MAGSTPDEDESVLDLSYQTKRPEDTAVRQQRVKSWNPYLDPTWVIITFYAIGIIFIPTGFKCRSLSHDVVEMKVQYDAHDDPSPICGIGENATEGKICENIPFVAPKDMNPPILVHYEIENFYQNQRTYSESRDTVQLGGNPSGSNLGREACEPLLQLQALNQTITLNPCGLIANTLFNDIFTLTSGTSSDGDIALEMIETGIAWKTDLEYVYAQPQGFQMSPCPDGGCDASCCDDADGVNWSESCSMPYNNTEDALCYRYFYPDDATTQYLHETYPDVVSPLEGVTNEHFVVWMRVAALPRFRKLYGYIEQPIAKGTQFNFTINANWEVSSFKGTKSLIVSTNNIFGGKNDWLGNFFIGVGAFCIGAGIFFTAKQTFKPRKVADKKYLRYKED